MRSGTFSCCRPADFLRRPRLLLLSGMFLALCLYRPGHAEEAGNVAGGTSGAGEVRRAEPVSCEMPPQLRRTLHTVVQIPGRVEVVSREVCMQRGGREATPVASQPQLAERPE